MRAGGPAAGGAPRESIRRGAHSCGDGTANLETIAPSRSATLLAGLGGNPREQTNPGYGVGGGSAHELRPASEVELPSAKHATWYFARLSTESIGNVS